MTRIQASMVPTSSTKMRTPYGVAGVDELALEAAGMQTRGNVNMALALATPSAINPALATDCRLQTQGRANALPIGTSDESDADVVLRKH